MKSCVETGATQTGLATLSTELTASLALGLLDLLGLQLSILFRGHRQNQLG